MYDEVVNYNNKYKSELIKVMKHSSKNIEFVLYPFFSEDDDVFNLKPEYIVDMTNSTEIVLKNNLDNCIVDWKDGIQLYINNNNNTYIIKKDGNFISGFSDKDTHFQLGDCCTAAYKLNNGELMIYNYGDVSSAVIIRFL